MSYWLQQHHRPQRHRALSLPAITEAALVILESDGEDGLNLRTLATQLGVVSSSLYRHVRSRQDVLDLALDAALAVDPQVMGELNGQDPVGMLLAWRTHLLRRPWTITHVMRRIPLGPSYLALADRLCALLHEHGIPDEQLLSASYAMGDFVLGCVLAERNTETSTPPWPASLLNCNYPHLHRAVTTHQPSWETVTRQGLERLAENNYSPPSYSPNDL